MWQRKVSRTPSAVADLKMEVPSRKHGKEFCQYPEGTWKCVFHRSSRKEHSLPSPWFQPCEIFTRKSSLMMMASDLQNPQECVPYIGGNQLREQQKTNRRWKQTAKETVVYLLNLQLANNVPSGNGKLSMSFPPGFHCPLLVPLSQPTYKHGLLS